MSPDRNQGEREHHDERAVADSTAVRVAMLPAVVPGALKGIRLSLLNVFNLLQWCFSRLIPAQSPQYGSFVNPPMATLAQGLCEYVDDRNDYKWPDHNHGEAGKAPAYPSRILLNMPPYRYCCNTGFDNGLSTHGACSTVLAG